MPRSEIYPIISRAKSWPSTRERGGFKAHEKVTVIGVEDSCVRVQREAFDGSRTVRRLHPGDAKAFDVCQKREIKIAPGDKLLLQANRRSAGTLSSGEASASSGPLINGEIVEVESIDNGHVRLTDGRTLPPTYRQFCHGYAVTSHASQGKTVDEVVVVATTASFGAVNREQFYVSISRGRERCSIFTDDKEALADRIGCSRQRVAAMELAQALRNIGYPVKEPKNSEPKATPQPPRPNPVSELLRIFQQLVLRITTTESAPKTALVNQPHPNEKLQVVEEKPQIKEALK